MDFPQTNYFENNFCHGCLSFGRRCSMIIDNASLFYQLLDPINIMKEPMSLILCWECEATLKKLRIFQYKVNKAQARLQDVITHRIEHKSLSTLTRTTKNIYDQIITDSLQSPSLKEHDLTCCKVILKKLNSTYKVQKVPKDNNNIDVPNEDIKINNYNIEIEVETQDMQSEMNKETNNRDEKYTVAKEEKIRFEDCENRLFKLEGLKYVIKKSEQVEESKLEIKQELEDYYSDDNYLAEDHITLDVTAKEIKSEKLLKSNIQKQFKKLRVQRNRAKRSPIDYDNVEKYFNKFVLPPDAFKAQLCEWANEKNFKASKYKCTACARVFQSEDEQHSHQELHSNTTVHKCDLCNISFKSEVELVSHGAAHEFHQCVICLFFCRTPEEREGHLKVSHRRGFWQCDQCTLSFRVQTELTAHKDKLHRTFTCDFCNTKRNSKQSILKHIDANHMRIKVLQCHLCVRRFRRKHELKEHLLNLHNIGVSAASKNLTCDSISLRAPQLESAAFQYPRESTYCVECNKQYTSKHKFNQHLRSSIVHTPKKKIQVPCPVCGKLFSKKCYLNNHYKLFHGGGTKHRCDPCNKFYATAYGLRMHLLRYHKKIPMPKTKVCETCGLGFQTNRILIHHMRTHTGERPHECSYCPARFAQKYARDVHVRNVHLKHLQPFIT